ncbi:transcription elongation factor GreA [Lysobacter yananisis]
MGGPSGPMLSSQIGAIRPESIGPEGPPTGVYLRISRAVFRRASPAQCPWTHLRNNRAGPKDPPGVAPQRNQGMRAPITAKGALRLRAELEELKSVKRPAVINAIAEARAHGDLKENAEYHAAREQQGFIEGRIKQLEAELSHAQIIDTSTLNAGSKVVFGANVELADTETDEEKRYQIVGDLEADIKLGLIAISSPVARALIGKNEGDTVVIEAPGGTREYEIVGVSYEG